MSTHKAFSGKPLTRLGERVTKIDEFIIVNMVPDADTVIQGKRHETKIHS